MFEIKNGIMYKDGKKVLGLGAAYYASFHKLKMPVPPFSDQIGEMKKDIAKMKDAGMNIVRTAALGKFDCSGGSGKFIPSPLIDEMMKTIEENELAAFIRIQGYSMKLKDYENTSMISSTGSPYKDLDWSNFLNDSIHHSQVASDNYSGTKIIADHYKDMDSIVAFLTYNEPHYPADGVYDYSEYAINDYRKWLKENNINLSDNLDTYEPPRHRPKEGERIEDWVYWRMFSMNSMSEYLNKTAYAAKEINPRIQSLTCMTPNMLECDNFIKGCNFYDVASGMDMLGITVYKNSDGADYYALDMILNSAECAASLYGKHAWMVELDAGTPISIGHFNRETYMTVGSGYKGIIYYQWRGDYPLEGTPEPNMFGFINTDGTKTEHFTEKMNMLKLLKELSDVIVNSEKHHSGVAILHSDYAAMYSDAVENIHEKTTGMRKNTYISRVRRYYKELKCEGVTVDIVRSEHLKENKLGIKALFVPEFSYLSEREKKEVESFKSAGGKVFVQAYDKWQNGLEKFGFDELGTLPERYTSCYEISEALEYAGVKPFYTNVSNVPLGINVLESDDCYLLSVVNISKLHPQLTDVKIKINADFLSAKMLTPSETSEVDVNDKTVNIPVLGDGCILILKK